MQLGKAVNDTLVEHSPIRFRLNASSGVPSYVQIVVQVEQALRIGYLNVGDRLPRIKEVVESLAINPNTVLKAYKELETKGIAVGRPGVGTFIVAAPPTLSAEVFDQLRQELVNGWLESAKKAGLDHVDIITLVQSTLESLLPTTRRSLSEESASDQCGPDRRGLAQISTTHGPAISYGDNPIGECHCAHRV